VLQGEVEILKACKVYINVDLEQSDSLSGDGNTKGILRAAYINAFLDNYSMIFWPFMDVTKKAMDEILGIKPGVSFGEIRLKGAKHER
jgi:hypothetical protein